jgi:3-hydroxyacyl-CoA dehydrogenase/enoyl-CoA hydratase/3-hydroxybutyryl-CoA epimerase
MSDSKTSSIGLPETKLGILPGFGGTYRLPRVVGLPKALDIILAGKTLRPTQALKAGLVDQLSTPEALIATAEQVARKERTPQRKKLALVDRVLSATSLTRLFVARKARSALLKQTKGFYPAPPKALDITVQGMGLGRKAALTREAVALGDLITSKESKALVHLFFLTESSKSLGKAARKSIEGIQALLVGAGTMGAGIAGTMAKNNHPVIVKDTSQAALQRGQDHVKKELSKQRHLSSFERAAIATKIDWLQFASPTMARTGIVIEAVFENMDLKKKIFSDLAQRVGSECILATNTSSLSVTEMATAVPDRHRFIGMHFFNPVEKMPLVEIIRGRESSDEVIAKVAALSTEMGKYPIVVEDVPGFLINRILIPYLNEAVFLLQEGHSVEAIDTAALAFGMPMGPIRLLDEVGLDVAAHVSKVMVAGYGERMAVPDFAEKLQALGRKGRKNAAGFYDYKGKESAPWSGLHEALKLPQAPAATLTQDQLTDRLICHLVNEAMKCLTEGVAGTDRELAKKQIDLGTVMGIGFPPFKGGVLYYAELLGLEKIHATISALYATYGIRYAPFDLAS